jgi:hypothetical protein
MEKDIERGNDESQYERPVHEQVRENLCIKPSTSIVVGEASYGRRCYCISFKSN